MTLHTAVFGPRMVENQPITQDLSGQSRLHRVQKQFTKGFQTSDRVREQGVPEKERTFLMLIKLLHRHGICPDCAEALYPDIALYDDETPGYRSTADP